MTRPDPLEVALSLAREAGWYVFPVNPDPAAGKRPYVNWNEAATTDHEQIATWWTIDYPGAYVGVHAGLSGLVVVDIDEKNGKSGSANLVEGGYQDHPMGQLNGIDVTLAYPTPSGGEHVVFAAPEGRDLTVAQNHPVDSVDIRSGNGFAVYYGPAMTAAPILAPAPEWSLVERRGSSSVATSIPLDTWYDRLATGKPSKDVRKARDSVTATGMAHGDMLDAVTRLVQLGAEGQPGVRDAMQVARTEYTRDFPEYARHWDAAVEGSVAHYGAPPVTFDIPKAEKKALKARAEGKVMAAPAAGEATHSNDLDVATEVTALLSGSWIYIMASGLYRYTGKVWESTEKLALEDATSRVLQGIVKREIKRVYALEAMAERDKKTLAGQWASYLNAGKIASVARLVTGQMGERRLELDSHPDLLNAQNGVVDLRTRELLPHDPAYLFTKIAGASYEAGATSRLWRAALKAFQSKATREYMQVRLGQAITGHTPDDHKVAFLHGSGGNGKSTILDGCVTASGSYSVKVDKSLLLGNANVHPTVFMDLKGARFAYFEEPPGGAQLNMERIKDLAGTAEIKGRYMGQDFQTFPATHSLMGSTNHAFQVSDTDDGTWRRLMLVSFPWKFTAPEDKPKRANERRGDARLKDAFKTPDPAVLAWLVDGAYAWYQNGQTMPEAPADIRRSTQSWRGDTDQVLAFAAENLEIASGYAIPVSYLYAEFRSFLKQRGRSEWSDETIRDRMFQHAALPDVEKAKVREGRNWRYSKPPLVLLNGHGPNPAAPNWCYVNLRFKSEAERQAEPRDALVTDIRKAKR
jgi:putative DNA primase/helicase